MTHAQHRAIGRQLRAIRSELMSVAREIRASYPKTSKPSRQSARAVAAVDNLRSDLENALCKESPARSRDLLDVYYGARS
jgi:hypothetical protein